MAALDGVFGRSHQLLLNKFFDPSTPSLIKGCDGEEEEVEKKRIVKNLTNISPTDQIKAPFQSFKFWEKKKIWTSLPYLKTVYFVICGLFIVGADSLPILKFLLLGHVLGCSSKGILPH